MSPRRIGALVAANDPSSKTVWIVDAVDMDGEVSINRFIQNNPGCFGKLLKFVDVDEKEGPELLDFEEYVRVVRELESQAQEVFRQLFEAESRVVDLDMEVDGRKVRCCCALE